MTITNNIGSKQCLQITFTVANVTACTKTNTQKKEHKLSYKVGISFIQKTPPTNRSFSISFFVLVFPSKNYTDINLESSIFIFTWHSCNSFCRLFYTSSWEIIRFFDKFDKIDPQIYAKVKYSFISKFNDPNPARQLKCGTCISIRAYKIQCNLTENKFMKINFQFVSGDKSERHFIPRAIKRTMTDHQNSLVISCSKFVRNVNRES